MPPQIYAFNYTFQILFYAHSLAYQCHPAFHSPIFGAKEVSYTGSNTAVQLLSMKTWRHTAVFLPLCSSA